MDRDRGDWDRSNRHRQLNWYGDRSDRCCCGNTLADISSVTVVFEVWVDATISGVQTPVGKRPSWVTHVVDTTLVTSWSDGSDLSSGESCTSAAPHWNVRWTTPRIVGIMSTEGLVVNVEAEQWTVDRSPHLTSLRGYENGESCKQAELY